MGTLLKKSVCKIKCGEKFGTGFFIGPSKILTADHVIALYDENVPIEITNYNKDRFVSSNVHHCEGIDIALIEIDDQHKNAEFLKVCDAEIIKDVYWEAYGRPVTNDGQKVGQPLSGTIMEYIEVSVDTGHDINLTVDGYSLAADFEGFSGSPVVDLDGDAFGVITFQNQNNLSAISIKKIHGFLLQNAIQVLPDKLCSFEKYASDLFNIFQQEVQDQCEGVKASLILSTPDNILQELKGGLFYPEKGEPVVTLTKYLRKNHDVNKYLWKGWLQFLTYVNILNGHYDDIKNITISINVPASQILGKQSNIPDLQVRLKLNFYFTDATQLIEISKRFIHNKVRQISSLAKTCTVFNSVNQQFGLGGPITNAEKKKIVQDISSPGSSGFVVQENIEFGLIALLQMTKAAAESPGVRNTLNNLQNVFQNAIG